MALGKQAKTLSKQQVDAVLNYLTVTRNPVRNRVIFLLSIRAGLRAKEIAGLTWSMVTNSDSTLSSEISIPDRTSKGKSGRIVPMSKELQLSLTDLRREKADIEPSSRIVTTERSSSTSAQVIVNLFRSWYISMGFEGCSSHSGRRTFITTAARKISLVGGSLRDVQALAGHSSLTMTQRYIEINADAKRKVVELLGG